MIPEFINPVTLKEIAYYQATEDIRHDFSEDEMIDLKENLYSLTQENFEKKILLDGVKVILKESTNVIEDITNMMESKTNFPDTTDMKSIDKKIKNILRKIKDGYEIASTKIFGVDHQDEGLMAIYDQVGNLITTRKLFQSERQTTIFKNIQNN